MTGPSNTLLDQRRSWLQGVALALAGLGLLGPTGALHAQSASSIASTTSGGGLDRLPNSWPKAWFEAQSIAQALALMSVKQPQDAAGQLVIQSADIAENGAMVPISLQFQAPCRSVAVLVDKNPNCLAALLEIDPRIPSLSLPIKMSQSAEVYVLARTQAGGLVMARKEIKVTLGGCVVG